MIKGKKINLRLAEESDIEVVAQYFSRVDNRGFENILLNHEVGLRKEFQENGWWGDDFGILQIVDKENKILGSIVSLKTFVQPNRRAIELGFMIYSPDDWGKGYTSEAISLFVPFLFETRTVNRIQAITVIDNIGSQKVLEKNGFTFEGVLRKMFIHHGKPVDVKMYSILREESKALADVLV